MACSCFRSSKEPCVRSIHLVFFYMAKKAVPKTKAVAKASVKKTAAKTKPGKFAAKAAVKAEKGSPKPNKKVPKLELVEAAEEPSGSSGTTLGYPRGTVSALLTSLKYQQKAVKNTQEQKDNAAKALEEYKSGDLATQRTILANLSKYGVQNCSWVHSLQSVTTTTETEGERVITNFLTRKAIFEKEGIDTSELTPEQVDEVFEDILAANARDFGYERKVQKHGKFAVLDKFLFKWSEGQTNDTNTSKMVQHIANVNNMKKGQEKAMKMLKMQTFEGEPTDSEMDKPSESFTLLLTKRKELEAFRNRLSKISEDLLFLLTQVESLQDSSWDQKKQDVNGGLSTLNGFLSKLRLKLSQKLPVDKTSDHSEAVTDLSKLLEEASARVLFQEASSGDEGPAAGCRVGASFAGEVLECHDT